MRRTLLWSAIPLLLPCAAFALGIETGVSSDVPSILRGIVNVLLAWSGLVATGLFLIGAFLMVASGGSEANLAAGKKIMKAALIGLAIILASWMILSTVIWFIAG
jgi:hypothetical protein